MLSEEDAARVEAAVKGMETFVDTLMLVTETQDALKRAGKPQQPATDAGQAGRMNLDQPSAHLV